MDGVCLRHKLAGMATLASAPAIFWIVEADLERVRAWNRLAPQFLDVINPATDNKAAFYAHCQAFKNLILNTESSIHYVGPEPAEGRKTWVIPHHHCNFSGYRLPEARLAKPQVVGYVGDPVHLHDTDVIKTAVEKMGLRFLNAPTSNLAAYQEMDIGIAWTRRDEQRDLTRSNIKMVNFASHGIPSVLCDYESYRTADATLGGGASLIERELKGFLIRLAELARNEELRRSIHKTTSIAEDLYSVSSIAKQYRVAIMEQSTS